MKRTLAIILVTASMLAVSAIPALAQPVFTGGLINVNVTDVVTLEEVAVQVPIGVAANVCGLSVGVLAELAEQGPVDCTSSTTQDLPVAFRP